MRHLFTHLFIASIIFIGVSSCHSHETSKENILDTAQRMTTDTTMLPGTPGPSGTQPRPEDTTQAHRDSLKHVVRLPDSTGKYSGN